jgi:hypothetical protein
MSDTFQDPRPALLSSIDITASRVVFSDTPIVLLCGGKVKIKERPDDIDPPVASLRHAITVSNTSFEVFLPEDIKSWLEDRVYTNLLSFESDLASICSLVVIVLESAGAIAELGAFSQFEDLSKKLIVIRSNDFINDPSFINLGVLRHISERNTSSIKNYPWDVEKPTSITPDVIADVI